MTGLVLSNPSYLKNYSKNRYPPTTFHGLRDTHASFLFSNNIPLSYVSRRLGHDSILTTEKYYSYVSRRLGHDSILTTEKYYLELMPEKKHSQDANALNSQDFLCRKKAPARC